MVIWRNVYFSRDAKRLNDDGGGTKNVWKTCGPESQKGDLEMIQRGEGEHLIEKKRKVIIINGQIEE
jgi:hypothetical protein